MKKRLLSLCLLCALSAGALQAQRAERWKDAKADFEKFKVERREFITLKMNLTDEEKTGFWHLADEFHLKKFELNKALRKEIRAVRTARKAQQPVAEETYRKLVELAVQTRLKEAQLEEEYLEKFMKVVSAAKVFAYQEAERQYGERFMEKRGKRATRPRAALE
ncbi:MAG: hypothetical protein LBH61_05935 [Dysgonamonadaceae bacterium]|jgi:glucosamine 6-phosphate synthetase-like amidotransferase/phosphosugar isomerase protein|nr:hypothetical protein [Dysgonamonadaceae bacterium]